MSGTSMPNPNAFIATINRLFPYAQCAKFSDFCRLSTCFPWYTLHFNAYANRSARLVLLLYTTILPLFSSLLLPSPSPSSSSSSASVSRIPNRSCDRRTSCITAAIKSAYFSIPSAYYTRYRTFLRTIAARNFVTSFSYTRIILNNRPSSAGGNVAVNITNYVFASINLPNSYNFGLKLPRPSNAV
ncbi:hypothetical protein GTA08_BOTSDO13048 [Botryosphaeria dothidea]|uniref:Uncharacterized protein n=1 Tax=Botryosphaeria dothidea TaxID=55169 RepID=A0A8H4J1M5_9PEZI|nr:hypothetical protein GTA08_BOTSDO13048 [Botryosphaeria dothidea]